jgi:hypothetical protein
LYQNGKTTIIDKTTSALLCRFTLSTENQLSKLLCPESEYITLTSVRQYCFVNIVTFPELHSSAVGYLRSQNLSEGLHSEDAKVGVGFMVWLNMAVLLSGLPGQQLL